MSADEALGRPPARSLPWIVQVLLVLALGGAVAFATILGKARSAVDAGSKPPPVREQKPFVPTPAQLATFTVREVTTRDFQVESGTEGKISVDEDRATPVFSPYSGRVIRLVARPGDIVRKGQLLFTVEATDMVQAQTDLITANAALSKARSQLGLAGIVATRQRDLFASKAIALKELQTAENDLVTAQSDTRSAESGLEAVRNRLLILGKTDAEITAFLSGARLSPETPIEAPLAGTVTQRRVGPGQYVNGGSGDPPYTIGDLSTVWLLANVRESDAPNVAIGQTLRFRVLAAPDRTLTARINYVAASIDPTTRRIQVRAEVPNPDGLLKPEMFASVSIATGTAQTSPAVGREAVIYEADRARVWVIAPDGSAALRRVTTGIVSGDHIQILSGLQAGERIVTKGSLFIDRLASGEGP